MHRIIITPVAIIMLLFVGSSYGITDIRDYLPDTWGEDTDLKSYIQTAFDTEDVKFFGSGDPYAPLVYPTTAGLIIPEGRKVVIGADAQLKRLPSEGALLEMYRFSELSCDAFGSWQGQINGNKAAHWPTYPDMGKNNGSAVHVRADAVECTIKKIYAFDTPGTAFGIYGSNNLIEQCKAENSGYIDLKFGADYYQSAWDAWSGDGFYAGGAGSSGNTFKNCESIDAFRWDYVPSHNSKNNTFIDCTGKDILWSTYGFVDFEDTLADGNNTLIRCDNLGSRSGLQNGNSVASMNTRGMHLDDCDLGDSGITSTNNYPGCTLNDVSMAYLMLGRYSDPNHYGDITFTGTIDINGPIVIENGGFDIIQSNGTINVDSNIIDAASYYPEPNTVYGITQNGGTMNVSGQIILGYREAITGVHNLSGGILNMTGANSGAQLVYGRLGSGAVNISNGSSITEDVNAAVPMALRWFEEGAGTLQGYGIVALTGWFVNNGKVIADGYGQEQALDLTSFSSINNNFSATGDTAPNDIENTTDNGWYAANGGKLILPAVTVSGGNSSVNWAERPSDLSIDLVNSIKVTFSNAAEGNLDISLLASDRSEISGNIWPIGVWDVNYTGSFDSAQITFRYDDAEAAGRGIQESELKVYKQSDGSFFWEEITGSVDTVNKHITTTPISSFSYFAVGTKPQYCGDTGTYYLYYDLSGLNSVPDCYVDFFDFADFASLWLCQGQECYEMPDLADFVEQWLLCTDPVNIDCY